MINPQSVPINGFSLHEGGRIFYSFKDLQEAVTWGICCISYANYSNIVFWSTFKLFEISLLVPVEQFKSIIEIADSRVVTRLSFVTWLYRQNPEPKNTAVKMFSIKVVSFKTALLLQTSHLYFQSAHDKTIHFNLKKAY